MAKKQETNSQTAKKLTPMERARGIARAAADAYFAALTSKVPFDTAPGKVNLVEVCNEIQDALLKDRAYAAREGAVEDSAFNAGFLMGIEVGLRTREVPAGGVR